MTTPTTTTAPTHKAPPRVTLELPLSGDELLDPAAEGDGDTLEWAMYRTDAQRMLAWEKQHHLYSSDRIEMGRVRGLFRYAGRLWVVMGSGVRAYLNAYEVLPEDQYGDEIYTYWEKSKAIEEGRIERHPFYRGMRFTWKSVRYVITGHGLHFCKGEPPDSALARCVPAIHHTPTIEELAPLPDSTELEQPSLFAMIAAVPTAKGKRGKKQLPASGALGDLAPQPLPKTKAQLEREARAERERARRMEWANRLRSQAIMWDRSVEKMREKLPATKRPATRDKYQLGIDRGALVTRALRAVADACEHDTLPPILIHLSTQTAIEALLDCPSWPNDGRWYALSNVHIERDHYPEARAAFLALLGGGETSAPQAVEQAS